MFFMFVTTSLLNGVSGSLHPRGIICFYDDAEPASVPRMDCEFPAQHYFARFSPQFVCTQCRVVECLGLIDDIELVDIHFSIIKTKQ